MRQVDTLTKDNVEEFFSNPKLKGNTPFYVTPEMENDIENLFKSKGWEIEKFDINPEGKWRGVWSLYPSDVKDGSKIVYNTTELTSEAYNKAIQRIKDEHNISDNDIVIYRNKSDDGFLYEKRYKVLRVIPKEHMSNASTDCAEVELETPYKRCEHPIWAKMTPEKYKEWNDEVDEHNEIKRGTKWFQEKSHIAPDDLHYAKQITTLRTLTPVNDFDKEFTARENAAYDIIQSANKAIDKATFSKWFKENKDKFNIK